MEIEGEIIPGVLFEDAMKRVSVPLMKAMINAKELGFGFIVVRRERNVGDMRIYHALWHEVDEALQGLGVRGGFKNPEGLRRKAPKE